MNNVEIATDYENQQDLARTLFSVFFGDCVEEIADDVCTNGFELDAERVSKVAREALEEYEKCASKWQDYWELHAEKEDSCCRKNKSKA